MRAITDESAPYPDQVDQDEAQRLDEWERARAEQPALLRELAEEQLTRMRTVTGLAKRERLSAQDEALLHGHTLRALRAFYHLSVYRTQFFGHRLTLRRPA